MRGFSFSRLSVLRGIDFWNVHNVSHMYDPFRPNERQQPSQLIYDGILSEATKRKGVDPDVWIPKERQNVWQIARDYAQQNGLRVLTLDEIERVESSASGHVDYASKWAYGVSNLLWNATTSADSVRTKE